jgi:hypothetical protein
MYEANFRKSLKALALSLRMLNVLGAKVTHTLRSMHGSRYSFAQPSVWDQ